MMYNVHDIANRIILRTDTERGDIMSNLKLQKLLYYMQGFYLAFFNKPLFENSLEAWMYGPVVPEVFVRFKNNSHLGIVLDPQKHEYIDFTTEEENLFSQVLDVYGRYSAVKLTEMTYKERPWKEAFSKQDKKISTEIMKDFFINLVDE